MKFRSLFLCTCMTVVPMTALLSHRLPGGVVQAAGGLLSSVLGGAEPEAEAEPLPPADVEPSYEAATGLATPVSAALPLATVPPAPATVPPMTPPPAAVMTDQGDLSIIHQRLAAVGAVAVDCRPLPGQGSAAVATCRVGVDADGSLFRMFQATGADPSSACRELLTAVELWRARPEGRSAQRPLDPQVGR
jgi:hypothetical protein